MSDVVFRSTASEVGFSQLGAWLQCPARAAAEAKQKQERMAMGPYPETEGKPVSTLVGSLLGEMVARYYRQDPIRESSQLFWEAGGVTTDLQQTHPLSVREAWRLYEAYVRVHGPEYYGDPVGFEIGVELPTELFGVRVTGAIDAMFRLTAQSAERIRTKFERPAEAGQLAQVDWKTNARATELWDWTLKPVMQIYAVGFHLATGEKPEHLCWDVIKKTKTPGFEEYYSDAATEAHVRWLKQVFAEIKRRQDAGPVPEPSPSNCVTYGNTCSLLNHKTGFCSII